MATGAVDVALEDVSVVCVIGFGRLGRGERETLAELGKEELGIGALGGTGVLPDGDEGLDGGVWGLGEVGRHDGGSSGRAGVWRVGGCT